MTNKQNKCPYCTFDKEGRGYEFSTGKPVNDNLIYGDLASVWDEFQWLERDTENSVDLWINSMDSEYYERENHYVQVDYCPKCGRKLVEEG